MVIAKQGLGDKERYNPADIYFLRYPTDCSRLLGIIFFCRKSMVAKKGFNPADYWLFAAFRRIAHIDKQKTGRLLSRFLRPDAFEAPGILLCFKLYGASPA